MLNGKSILWVEDDKLIASILSKKLIDAGAKVSLARTGEEFFAELEKNTPNLAILDIDLPGGMNGIEILQKLRANPVFRSLPVVILSNNESEVYKEKARLLHVSKYLTKVAVTPEHVVAEVAGLI
jgi:CheY-like chemotaxis protein